MAPLIHDRLLEIFLEWTMDQGIELYPAQEEAVLEVFAGKHVILNTPTGSGEVPCGHCSALLQLCFGR